MHYISMIAFKIVHCYIGPMILAFPVEFSRIKRLPLRL